MKEVISDYTVSAILDLYRNIIRSSFDETLMSLEGFFKASGNKVYNGVFYDSLYDEDKQQKLTVIIKEEHRKNTSVRSILPF